MTHPTCGVLWDNGPHAVCVDETERDLLVYHYMEGKISSFLMAKI